MSNLGRVRSWRRMGRGSSTRGPLTTPRILKPYVGTAGYITVSVSSRPKEVHLLVLEAFRGPRPSPEHEGCHKSGDQADPRLANLRWGTKLDNAADRDRHGTTAHGEGHGKARLTDAAVRDIRTSSESSAVLAMRHSVTRGHVNDIRRGRGWVHVAA